MNTLPEIVVVRVGSLPKIMGLVEGDPIPTVLRFSDEALQSAVDRLLDGLPADSRAAEIEVGFDAQGVQVVGAVRLSVGWSLLGGVSYDYGASWRGQVGIRWSGK